MYMFDKLIMLVYNTIEIDNRLLLLQFKLWISYNHNNITIHVCVCVCYLWKPLYH